MTATKTKTDIEGVVAPKKSRAKKTTTIKVKKSVFLASAEAGLRSSSSSSTIARAMSANLSTARRRNLLA